MNQPDPSFYLPLREPTFFILLSLTTRAKHGYAILKDVEALSNGKVRLSTGTLYEALARLLEQRLIERVYAGEADDVGGEEATGGPGKPRKMYCLSGLGWQVILLELERLEVLVATARLHMEGKWAGLSGL